MATDGTRGCGKRSGNMGGSAIYAADSRHYLILFFVWGVLFASVLCKTLCYVSWGNLPFDSFSE